MKKTNNAVKVSIAAIALSFAVFLTSCNKDLKDQAPLQSNSSDNGVQVGDPIAYWSFDSTWNEYVEGLTGTPYRAHYTSPQGAEVGTAAFLSKDSGYVAYNKTGNAIPNIKAGFTVDFWVFAYPSDKGAQCIWCEPQTGAFWPDMHVLIDGYNTAKGDTGLIKIMFKANRPIAYNEEWTEIGNIPKFYKRWTHIQYAYNGNNSRFTAIVNNKTYVDHAIKYTADPNDSTSGAEKLGKILPNPAKKGLLIGTFQNRWNPSVFGDPQSWMLPFRGRIDEFKIYNSAQF